MCKKVWLNRLRINRFQVYTGPAIMVCGDCLVRYNNNADSIFQAELLYILKYSKEEIIMLYRSHGNKHFYIWFTYPDRNIYKIIKNILNNEK